MVGQNALLAVETRLVNWGAGVHDSVVLIDEPTRDENVPFVMNRYETEG